MRRVNVLTAAVLAVLLLAGCARTAPAAEPRGAAAPVGSMELQYAGQFSVDYYANGVSLVTIAGEEQYLLVPEGTETPEGVGNGATVLYTPMEQLYLASSAAMDPFRRLGALNHVRFTGTVESDWDLPEVKAALESGELLYAGKYRAPDYELLLSEGCSLAVENTMILHSPATREQLESLGIPTIIERSSYESHPLGRMEWIKFYGLLVGKETEAEAFFSEQTAALESVLGAQNTGKTAAFFYLSPNGYVNVRRPGDYVSKMIELAGGIYVPAEIKAEDNALSTLNMQMEAFYAGAKDADVLIYNSNIYPMESLSQLLEENELFADFKAVREGNVWCAGENMFQETTAVGGMISDIHAVLSGTAEETELTYLHRLR